MRRIAHGPEGMRIIPFNVFCRKSIVKVANHMLSPVQPICEHHDIKRRMRQHGNWNLNTPSKKPSDTHCTSSCTFLSNSWPCLRAWAQLRPSRAKRVSVKPLMAQTQEPSSGSARPTRTRRRISLRSARTCATAPTVVAMALP